MAKQTAEIYTQDYRHFDSLIWQVPAWGSAIFSFAVTAAFLALSNSKSIAQVIPVCVRSFVTAFLISVFVIIILLINVYLRFRLHQRVIHRPHRIRVPRLWFMVPGQTSLLLILFIEAPLILWFALLTAGANSVFAACLAAIFLLAGFGYVERSVRKLSARLRESRQTSEPKS